MSTRPDRLVRGALRRLVHGQLTAWYHPTFRLPLAGLESQLGIDPRRALHVLTWAMDLGVLRPADLREAPESTWAWARLVHDEAYLGTLDRREVVGRILGLDERTVHTASMLETWRRSAGATVAAARAVVEEGGRAAVLLGGWHHAMPARGGGFCALNDVAMAVAVLRQGGFAGRVVVLDLDAHPPDGTAACLAEDAGALVVSLSAESAWDEVPGCVDLRLPRGSGDDAYSRALDEALPHLDGADLVLYLAGADPLGGDPFGGLGCTEEGLRRRDRAVLEALGPTPVVLLPAGGYTRGAWRVFAGAVAEAAGAGFGPAPGYDPTRRRTLDIAHALDPESLSGRSEEEWITPDELREALGMAPSEERLLGYYTRQGVEYALDRFGFLDLLRRMGFEGLRVEVHARHDPHTLRVLAQVDGHEEALVEIGYRHQPVGRWDTLFVEWLSLRDPRATFSDGRPRLPGQDTPGLGLLDDVGHVNLRIAERLDLDGLSFVPSWYHIARFARRKWIVVDPDQRGMVHALHAHLRDVPLLQATNLLAGAGVPVEIGEPVRWDPPLMVYPRNPDLRAWLEEGDRRARDVADGLASRLLPAS